MSEPPHLPDRVRRFYDVVDRLDADGWGPFLAVGARLQFGNGPGTVGRASIIARISAFNATWLASMRHEFLACWRPHGATIVEFRAAYTRRDGERFDFPGVTVLRHDSDGNIEDMRVFIDATPLTARQLLPAEHPA